MDLVKKTVLDRLKTEAEKEIQAEFEDKAKSKLKCKLRDIALAKRVITNLQKELDDLYAELDE